jgi:mono/diheme cytochrome c family protein
MRIKQLVVLAFALIAWTTILPDFIVQKAEARSKYMKLYNANPFAKSERKNDCKICHISDGGGENTYFGEAFAEAKYKFSEDLRAKYQDLFNHSSKKKVKK